MHVWQTHIDKSSTGHTVPHRICMVCGQVEENRGDYWARICDGDKGEDFDCSAEVASWIGYAAQDVIAALRHQGLIG